MTDSAVEINVDAPDENPPANDDTTVVVVTDSGDSGSAEAEQDMALIVGELRAKVEQLEGELAATRATAEVAEMVAEDASATANKAVEQNIVEQAVIADVAESVEETQEVLEDEAESGGIDTPPAKLPWTHRPLRGMFGRD